MKYAIPLLFVSGIAFAQAPAPQPPTAQPQPTPPQQAQPSQPQQAPNPAHMNARNTAIQQIEQALQQLKSNNQ